jgi:hypothetical protein
VGMGKGGLCVYNRAPCDYPVNMKLEKLILEKNKKVFEKMKISKSNPFHPLTHSMKKLNKPTPKI